MIELYQRSSLVNILRLIVEQFEIIVDLVLRAHGYRCSGHLKYSAFSQ